MRKAVRVFSLFLFIALFSAVVANAAPATDEVKELLNQAIRAEQGSEYQRAVELFRQVLYVDGENSRAQFGVAFCSEQLGDVAKAVNEYKRFLSVASLDKTLQEQERVEFVAYAEKMVSNAAELRSRKLGLLEIDVLILAGVMTILLLWRLVCCIRSLNPEEDQESKELKRVWLDCEWLQGKEKIIHRFPWCSYVTLGMVALTAVLYVMTYLILFK